MTHYSDNRKALAYARATNDDISDLNILQELDFNISLLFEYRKDDKYVALFAGDVSYWLYTYEGGNDKIKHMFSFTKAERKFDDIVDSLKN